MNFEKTTWITVTFKKEGIHRYPAAENIEGVQFLAHPHRHLFGFKVWLEVMHNDRDVEFILFKRELESLFTNGVMDIDYKSCEMLAEDMIGYINNKYPGRSIKVEVDEDGENSALVEFIRKD